MKHELTNNELDENLDLELCGERHEATLFMMSLAADGAVQEDKVVDGMGEAAIDYNRQLALGAPLMTLQFNNEHDHHVYWLHLCGGPTEKVRQQDIYRCVTVCQW